jgi:hypothetical protein
VLGQREGARERRDRPRPAGACDDRRLVGAAGAVAPASTRTLGSRPGRAPSAWRPGWRL